MALDISCRTFLRPTADAIPTARVVQPIAHTSLVERKPDYSNQSASGVQINVVANFPFLHRIVALPSCFAGLALRGTNIKRGLITWNQSPIYDSTDPPAED